MDVANFAFWHVWEGWQSAIWFGLGCGVMTILGQRFLVKKTWRDAIIVGLLSAIFCGLLILAMDYHRFMKIWEDVIINGNIS